ncbi:hypothetical protein EXIGLDRAFT_608346, partial [Exidia glandulosa HHB12029]
IILCTPRLNCAVCPDHPSLHRKKDAHFVNLLLPDVTRTRGILVTAHCLTCKTIYWPDRLSVRPDLARDRHDRFLRLESQPSFLRVSKSSQLWVHRDIAQMQESAFFNLHSGWSSFANHLNSIRSGPPVITLRQVRRLFVEHFGRSMLEAHGLLDNFQCATDPNTDAFMAAVVAVLGSEGGKAPDAFAHHCDDCTHPKRYRQPGGGAWNGGRDEVVGLDENPQVGQLVSPRFRLPYSRLHQDLQAQNGNALAPAGAAALPAQLAPQQGPPLFVTIAVMDGKVIQHAICAVDACRRPLDNYRNGRFCAVHLPLYGDQCGIIPCGRPRATRFGEKFLACDYPPHKAFFESYQRRFGRLNFAGVQRVIRQQVQAADEGNPGLQLRARLPDVDGLEGNLVVHTFRPRMTYCIQTIQWACGYPIAWAKLYDSESTGNVARFLFDVWDLQIAAVLPPPPPPPPPPPKPSFIAYDKACGLLAHLQTSHPLSPWITATRFIVNPWHYIGHRADDDLCRTLCNPAPADGSQPDLVLDRPGPNGTVLRTRAFNMETAEQFNSWLDRYKSLLEQMSATSYSFVVHTLFFLYAKDVTRRISQREERQARQAAAAAALLDDDDSPSSDSDDTPSLNSSNLGESNQPRSVLHLALFR